MNLRVLPDEPKLRAVAADAARALDTDERALHLRLLLHLPRIAGSDGVVSIREAREEAARLAASLPPAAAWTLPAVPSLENLEFSNVDDTVARFICEQFHYLGSYREGGQPYGFATSDGQVVALAVTTDCDVDRLRHCALDRFDDANPRVLARVFSFEGTPPNTLTRFFKLVCRAERARGATSMVTYVNPNMGFMGASYRAGNWDVLGVEPGTTYRYIDGKYVTDRALARSLESAKVGEEALIRVFGERYERSHMDLQPLRIFGRTC